MGNWTGLGKAGPPRAPAFELNVRQHPFVSTLPASLCSYVDHFSLRFDIVLKANLSVAHSLRVTVGRVQWTPSVIEQSSSPAGSCGVDLVHARSTLVKRLPLGSRRDTGL